MRHILHSRRDVETLAAFRKPEEAVHRLVGFHIVRQIRRQSIARLLCTHDGAQLEEDMQHALDCRLIARREELCEVGDRDAHLRRTGEEYLLLDAPRNRAEGRDVPDIRQRTVLRMERKRDLPLRDQLVRGRVLCRTHPAVGDARLLCRRCDRRVVRVAERTEICLVDVLRIGRRCRRLHFICIVK